MRRTLFILSVSAGLAIAGAANAADRYGAAPVTPEQAQAPNWAGPTLNWAGKSAPQPIAAPISPAKTAAKSNRPAEQAKPEPLSDWAKRAALRPAVQPPAPAPVVKTAAVRAAAPVLPTSLYDPPPAKPAAPAPAPSQTASALPSKFDLYHPARPAGQPLNITVANLPPPGPTLERQEAAEDEAAVAQAMMARANIQAAAAGKPNTMTTTDLLGAP